MESLGIRFFDYYKDECFTIKNAYITAEGALSLAMQALETDMGHSDFAILGYGRIGSALGDEYAYNLHCHFSKIEYTSAGEKKHLTFEDTLFGPEFDGLGEAIVREGVCPRIICESAGTMAEDALLMKAMWQSAKESLS